MLIISANQTQCWYTVFQKSDAKIEITITTTNLIRIIYPLSSWRRGVAVERRTRDREVVGSSLGRALRRKNSGQVSHT